MTISENLNRIKSELPQRLTLIAVSKTKSVEQIMEAYEAGQRDFGENKIQEMVEKWHVLPKDIRWHMIGHVQRNKVKYMAPFVSMVHGVDSLKLLEEINKRAAACQRIIPCLLQLHIAEEETKFGLNEQEMETLLASESYKLMKNIRIIGLMGMATFTKNEKQIRKEFQSLKTIYDALKQQLSGLEVLSMGMSNDYHIAIEEGSTMVRIGSSIFGARKV